MKISESAKSGTKLFVRAALIVVMAVSGLTSPVMAQEESDVSVDEGLIEKGNRANEEAKGNEKSWQGRKNEDLSFENDTGNGQGHEDGKSGVRTGHSDEMPGQRQGHRKGENTDSDGKENVLGNDNDNNSRGNPGRIHDQARGKRHARRHDNDNNPPGAKGGPGTNWENRPGPQGGPGKSPDKIGGKRHARRHDNDNNPPGAKGGPGTNWENKPGPQGGPGKSPDRIGRRRVRGAEKITGDCFRGNGKSGQEVFSGKRKGRKIEAPVNSSNEDSGLKGAKSGKGSNGLHIGNRKNDAGKGIKNYSGTNPGKGRK